MSAKQWSSALAALVVVAALAGCGTKNEPPPLVVPVPSFKPPQASSSPAARIVGALPTGCGAIATPEEVASAVGRAMNGTTKLVNGTPDTKIGRTARIDCYYGLTEGQQLPDAPVAVGLASYTDADAANKRVSSTVDGEKQAGAKVSDVQVGADKGKLMVGKKIATLVATYKATTVVVIAQLDLVPEAQAPSVLGKIADRALSPH
ncbi:hypothetical protein [Actinocrispum wychmicini]|uniref:DUF5642 domain-containing protein n=1 Tax=Actinocrispum wychmicini TaxID=1213861 RepID=A0A4R2J8V6_9PSEU|nr:hypothetical protein [Actinocrispum wychmicini]TCO53046.1 hypothetical protein EV192_111243 [Actinocrispum wychmicini]